MINYGPACVRGEAAANALSALPSKIPAQGPEGAEQPQSNGGANARKPVQCPGFRLVGARRGTHPTRILWAARGC